MFRPSVVPVVAALTLLSCYDSPHKQLTDPDYTESATLLAPEVGAGHVRVNAMPGHTAAEYRLWRYDYGKDKSSNPGGL
jgi:hypothetical protein